MSHRLQASKMVELPNWVADLGSTLRPARAGAVA